MNDLLCSHCGDRTILARCAGCRQRETVCTCRPVRSQPEWLRRGAAKDMTERVAA